MFLCQSGQSKSCSSDKQLRSPSGFKGQRFSSGSCYMFMKGLLEALFILVAPEPRFMSLLFLTASTVTKATWNNHGDSVTGA